MNIFRLTGDLSHLAAIVILLLKIWKTRSCAGERPGKAPKSWDAGPGHREDPPASAAQLPVGPALGRHTPLAGSPGARAWREPSASLFGAWAEPRSALGPFANLSGWGGGALAELLTALVLPEKFVMGVEVQQMCLPPWAFLGRFFRQGPQWEARESMGLAGGGWAGPRRLRLTWQPGHPRRWGGQGVGARGHFALHPARLKTEILIKSVGY